MNKPILKLGSWLTIPIISSTMACSGWNQLVIDNIYAEEYAKEMTMIYYLDYDKIINQNLKGQIENLTPRKVIEEMKKEPIVIDFYNWSEEQLDNAPNFVIKDNLRTAKYNEVIVDNQVVTIKLISDANIIYSSDPDIPPENILQKGLSWINVGKQSTKFGPDMYVWEIQMTKEVILQTPN